MTTFALLAAALLGGTDASDSAAVIVVIGAPGAPEFGEQFNTWADRWEAAARRGEAKFIAIGRESSKETTDGERLRQALAGQSKDADSPLWVVLIGHGTFDRRSAKFNLRGPDLAATDLQKWLESFQRPVAVVNCASASGPFINRLAGPDRVIVTATKSGHEHNFARFGDHMSAAIADPAADLDKDEQTSLLEAFLAASKRTAEFYETDGRLATEHALLDDNADGLGTPATWFRGVRATRKAKDGKSVDGLWAAQFHLVPSARERALPAELRGRRNQLELAIAQLRQKKPQLSEDEYYDQLETLLVELARLYEQQKQ